MTARRPLLTVRAEWTHWAFAALVVLALTLWVSLSTHYPTHPTVHVTTHKAATQAWMAPYASLHLSPYLGPDRHSLCFFGPTPADWACYHLTPGGVPDGTMPG